MMSGFGGTNVVQVTNLSSAVNSDQMRTLFAFLGDIEELRLYPPDNAPLSFSSKVCYIKYREPSSVGVAQHLTNTVFIDRALIVVPCAEGKIPEEGKALSLLAPATPVPSLIPGGGLLPIPSPSPVQSPKVGVPVASLVALPSVLDIPATALAAVPAAPPLMGNVDPSKVDEIRRTVYVGNLNSTTCTAEQLLEFFKTVGDVKFVRMAGDETQPTRFAFVEFANQESVSRALTFNGVMFGDRPLKINHSNNAIVKPPELTPQAAAKELEDVMKRVREASSTIAAAIEPEEKEEKKRSSSRSASKRSRRSRTRSRSRSRTHRKRSRSRHRSRPSMRPPARVSVSHRSQSSQSYMRRPSPPRRDRRRSRSRSRGHRRRSRDRSRSPRRKLRSPSPRRGRKEHRRDRGRDNSRDRAPRKQSYRDKDKTELQAKPIKVERDYDREEKEEYDREEKEDYAVEEKDYESDGGDSASPSEEATSSPCAQHNGRHSAQAEDHMETTHAE